MLNCVFMNFKIRLNNAARIRYIMVDVTITRKEYQHYYQPIQHKICNLNIGDLFCPQHAMNYKVILNINSQANNKNDHRNYLCKAAIKLAMINWQNNKNITFIFVITLIM